MTTEHTENVCRFCLGSSNTENNPLIEPCNCTGTIKYVHSYCLTRWRISEYPIIARCSLCNSNYTTELCIHFEEHIMSMSYIRKIFRNGVMFFFLLNYFYFLMMKFGQKTTIYRMKLIDPLDSNQIIRIEYETEEYEHDTNTYRVLYKIACIIMYSIYNGIFFTNFLNVRNRLLYIRHWIDMRYWNMYTTIVFFFYGLLYTNHGYFLGGLIHVTYYPYIFIEHKKILENINRELIENVQREE
jgi:hypothetical protein